MRRISGDLAYGDAQADVHDELRDYSEGRASLFEDSVCACGGREFGPVYAGQHVQPHE